MHCLFELNRVEHLFVGMSKVTLLNMKNPLISFRIIRSGVVRSYLFENQLISIIYDQRGDITCQSA